MRIEGGGSTDPPPDREVAALGVAGADLDRDAPGLLHALPRTFAMNVSQIYDDDSEPVEMKIELEKAAN